MAERDSLGEEGSAAAPENLIRGIGFTPGTL